LSSKLLPLGPDTVLFGIGNSGRSDDGLGWAFLDRIQQEPEFQGRAEYRYQLQVEDAALIRDAGRVIFIDSFQGSLPGGFCWQACGPSEDFEFTTHVLPPGAVLYYCQDLYGDLPPSDILTIQGNRWDLHTGLSAEAEKNLDRAVRFFKQLILT
jgi:hydrogenase maturation protease